MFPPFLWVIKVKNDDSGQFCQFWSKIVVFQLLSPIKRAKLENIEYAISTLYFNSHDVHAYQFEGQLKIFSETRYNFRSKYHQIERSDIVAENPIISSKLISYRCLKRDFQKEFLTFYSFFVRTLF